MKRLVILSLATLMFSVPAGADDTSKAAKKKAARPDISASDRKAMIAEEKDRLAREKKDLSEREQALQSQLDTSKKLVSEKEALIKQLQEQIAAAKAGKPIPEDKPAVEDRKAAGKKDRKAK